MSYRVVSDHKSGTTYHGKFESFRDACREADAVSEWFPDRRVTIKEVGK